MCGDSWEVPHPQPHETGGKYGNAVISKTYVRGGYSLVLRTVIKKKYRFRSDRSRIRYSLIDVYDLKKKIKYL